MYFELLIWNLEDGVDEYDRGFFFWGQEWQERQSHYAPKGMTYNHVVGCIHDEIWSEVLCKGGYTVIGAAPSPCMPEEIGSYDKEP